MVFKKPITEQFVPLLYFIAVVYTVLNLGGGFLEIPGIFFLGVFISTVIYFFLRTLPLPLDRKSMLGILFITPLIFINCSLSIELINTSLYWALWLMFIVSLLKVIQRFSQNDLENIFNHIPYILLTASLILYIILFPYLGGSLPTKNSLGLLAGGTLIAALSIKKTKLRVSVICLALFILFESDSRSSLVFAIGITALYLLSSVRSKNAPIFMLGIVLLLIFQGNLYRLLEEKMLAKELYATNLSEAIESAQKERTDLLTSGWKIYLERPIMGYGLKTKYYEGRLEVAPGVFVHVHNGYLSTLIETGVIISFFVFLLLIKLLYKIGRQLLLLPKSYDKIWLYFILFGLIRAYGENYLFFNIGNIFSIFFVFLCALLLAQSRLKLVLPRGQILPLKKRSDKVETSF